MCDVRKKLILFDYAITEFVNKIAELKKESKEKVLESFTTTRIMKLMYFASLLSVKLTLEYSQTPFSILNNWIAYGNGPVEDDVYRKLSYLPSYQRNEHGSYKERDRSDFGKITDFFGVSNAGEIDNRYKIDQETKINISKGIEEVCKMNLHNLPTEILIEISHAGLLWNTAQYHNQKKMTTNNLFQLKVELDEIKEVLKNNAA